MTRTAPAPVPLLQQFALHASEQAVTTAAAVEDARRQYWLVVDRIASGDASGGIDHASFAVILATLSIGVENVLNDVTNVQRVRQAQRDLDSLTASIADSRSRAAAATAEMAKAKAQFDEAEKAASHAAWVLHDAEEARTRVRLEIRDELRNVASGLHLRGFAGQLLSAPPPPPPPRRWRFRDGATASRYAGRRLLDDSEVDMPASYCGESPDTFGMPWTTCLGPVTPEMGPPKQFPAPMLSEQQRGERAEDMTPSEVVEVGGAL